MARQEKLEAQNSAERARKEVQRLEGAFKRQRQAMTQRSRSKELELVRHKARLRLQCRTQLEPWARTAGATSTSSDEPTQRQTPLCATRTGASTQGRFHARALPRTGTQALRGDWHQGQDLLMATKELQREVDGVLRQCVGVREVPNESRRRSALNVKKNAMKDSGMNFFEQQNGNNGLAQSVWF